MNFLNDLMSGNFRIFRSKEILISLFLQVQPATCWQIVLPV